LAAHWRGKSATRLFRALIDEKSENPEKSDSEFQAQYRKIEAGPSTLLAEFRPGILGSAAQIFSDENIAANTIFLAEKMSCRRTGY
jgi:hypothetical protein